jgi:hypothetical protein
VQIDGLRGFPVPRHASINSEAGAGISFAFDAAVGRVQTLAHAQAGLALAQNGVGPVVRQGTGQQSRSTFNSSTPQSHSRLETLTNQEPFD